MQSISFKSSILDSSRNLLITSDYIEYADMDTKPDNSIWFRKEEIAGFRYGVKWIQGYQFVIGRIYCIDIKNNDGTEIKLRLKSIYGIRKQQLGEKYGFILKFLFENFFNEISDKYINQFNNGDKFEILGVEFNSEGLRITPSKDIVLWTEVGTRDYQFYYTLFSISDPYYYRLFEYLNDWNTAILYSVSRSILRDKGLWS